MKHRIDISSEEKKKEIYEIFNSLKSKNQIHEYFKISDNKNGSEYIKQIANEIGFDLNIYKERKKRYCLQCGKELTKGQKKFCSISCSTSYNNAIRSSMSNETKQKIRQSLKKYYEQREHYQNTINKKNKCPICGRENCEKKGICKHLKKWFFNLVPFGFNVQYIGTVKVFEEYEKISFLLKQEYENGMSVNEIKEKFDYDKPVENLVHVLKKIGIPLRSYSEALRNAVVKHRVSIPSTPNQYKCEWHTSWEKIDCYLRSSYEKDFAMELDNNKIPYRVEFLRIKYWDEESNCFRIAIPDFYLPQTNEIYEIKSQFTFNKNNMVNKFKEYIKNGYTPFLILEHCKITMEEMLLL